MDYLNYYIIPLPLIFSILVYLFLILPFLFSFSFFFFFIIYIVIFLLILNNNTIYFLKSYSQLFIWFNINCGTTVTFTTVSDTYSNEFSLILILLGFLIQNYSYIYFKSDPDLSRFSILLNFFILFMLLMVNTDSWVFMFIAWEGVGLLSFLLVSFWYSKVNTFKSGIKVLFYNRLGDFFFFLTICLILFILKSDSIQLTQKLMEFDYMKNKGIFLNYYIEFFFMFSIMLVILSKSAQFGFHIWLLEAMEAPLPASSLIHSATLVCAGVVLFFKTSGFIHHISSVSSYVLIWSSLTALYLSTSACLNYDIKRILAYSTGSHVSLMLAISVAYSSFNGFTYTIIHASTKVFVFLLFGFIIDANGGIRDLRKMGGFFKKNELTTLGLIGTMFLSSLPLFPLAILKDGLVLNAYSSSFLNEFCGTILMLSSLSNYLYMFRIFFKIFFGDSLGAKSSYLKNLVSSNSLNYFYEKKTNILFKNPILIFLCFYIFFFESSVVFFFLIDYLYADTRIIDNVVQAYPDGITQFLSFSNSFFFLFLLTRFLHTVWNR